MALHLTLLEYDHQGADFWVSKYLEEALFPQPVVAKYREADSLILVGLTREFPVIVSDDSERGALNARGISIQLFCLFFCLSPFHHLLVNKFTRHHG